LALVDDVVKGLAVYFRLAGLHRVTKMERRWNINAVIAIWLVAGVVLLLSWDFLELECFDEMNIRAIDLSCSHRAWDPKPLEGSGRHASMVQCL
jgi:hypothetical protein